MSRLVGPPFCDCPTNILKKCDQINRGIYSLKYEENRMNQQNIRFYSSYLDLLLTCFIFIMLGIF